MTATSDSTTAAVIVLAANPHAASSSAAIRPQYGQRRALLRDRIHAMKALWTEDEASHAGEFVQIEPSWAWPKPAQRPHPPIVLRGAAGPKTAKHVAEFCDGWMPIGGVA